MYGSLPTRPLGWTLVLAGLLMVAALVAVSWQDPALAVVVTALGLGMALIGLGLLVLSEEPRHRTIAARVAVAGLVTLGLAAVVIRFVV